jgi:crotonobetainyl-CoA:carnitine CoA-transferase CaiB-like acyl-CoA transferase
MPLQGIRVLDLSRHAPGPYCTMLFADLGADVVMVEAPPGAARQIDEEMGIADRTKAFVPMNRNKRSIGLDLKSEAGREACLRLAQKADIVVESFRPGVATRLGVDYEAMRRRNPGVIYCSVTGYGQTGPYAQLPGHDLNYISVAGTLGMIGWPDQPPAIPINVIADFAGGGLYAAFSILAALQSRNRTGEGQYIDMAMCDGVMSLACLAASDYYASGEPPRPGRYFLNGAYPCYNVYQASDGKWLSIGCMEPWFWKNLCEMLGCEQYTEHQFDEPYFPEIFAFLRRKIREKTRDEWFAEMAAREVCATPVYGIDEALEDPHNRAREMVATIEHPQYGKITQIGVAPKFSATPGRVRTLAPKRGENTEEVLREAGFSEDEIARIRAPR